MDVFAALADPVRRSLLVDLCRGPARVVDLAAQRPISRPAVSRHLRVLTEAGLTSAEDRGRERWYALDSGPLGDVDDYTAALRGGGTTAPFGEAAMDALDLEVRRTVRERRTTQRGTTKETG